MREGAADYLTKPLNMDELLVVHRARARAAPACDKRRSALRQQLGERYKFENIIGSSAEMQAGVQEHLAGRAEPRHGPSERRIGYRQGARRRGDSPSLAARERARSCGCTARRSPRVCWRASCSATNAARSPAPIGGARGASSRPTAARCSSTRSARSRLRRRSSCCASSRSASSSASAAIRRSTSTCASSRRPTATSPRWSSKANSARICSTG